MKREDTANGSVMLIMIFLSNSS